MALSKCFEAGVCLLLLSISGCGTIGRLIDDDGCQNLLFSGTRASLGNPHGGFLDAPFSLVADIIVLPYTIPATIHEPDECQEDGKPPEIQKNRSKDGDET